MRSDKPQKSFAEYTVAFTSRLGDLVATVLDFPPGHLGVLKASTIYPTQLQVTAAAVGHETKLAEEAAIAFLVFAEAFRAEQETSFFAKWIPSKERDAYRERAALAQQVEHIMEIFKDSPVPNEFLSRLGRRLNQSMADGVCG